MSKVQKHFDYLASSYDYFKKKNKFYYSNLKKLLSTLIPQNKIVLEIGCGTGDLLASLKPQIGYGIDISSEMIKVARSKHKLNQALNFSTKKISSFKGKKLDFIFMSDVIEHLENPQETFKQISQTMNENTIFINTMANPKWEPILLLAEKLKLKMPEGDHYRWSLKEIESMISKFKLKITQHNYDLLLPANIPVVTSFINKKLIKVFKSYAFIEYFTAAKP